PILLRCLASAHLLPTAFRRNSFQQRATALSVPPLRSRLLWLPAIHPAIHSIQKPLRAVRVGLAAFSRLPCARLQSRADIRRAQRGLSTYGRHHSIPNCASAKLLVLLPLRLQNCPGAASSSTAKTFVPTLLFQSRAYVASRIRRNGRPSER